MIEARPINKTDNNGLFLTVPVKKGTTVYTISGEVSNIPTRTSIYIKGQNIENPMAKFLNHSFSPNCKIVEDNLVTIKDLEANTELTFNYLENEPEISSPFKDHETGTWVFKKKDCAEECNIRVDGVCEVCGIDVANT